MIFTDKEIKNRTFNSTEISQILNIPCGSLTTLKNKLKLDVKWIATPKGRQCIWTYEQYCIVRDYKNQQDAKRRARALNQKTVAPIVTHTEVKRSPLVTDERFYILSYFPDVVPNCFKESTF